MSGNRYQVFLSHSNRDKPFVRQVAARLQREGVTFFLDEAHLVPGEPWQVALERALGDSDSCAAFIGDEGLGPYHTLEMRAALSEQVEADRGCRLIPVLLPGKTRPAERNLPAFLKQLTWGELTADFIAGKTDGLERRVLPVSVNQVVMFLDVAIQQKLGDDERTQMDGLILPGQGLAPITSKRAIPRATSRH